MKGLTGVSAQQNSKRKIYVVIFSTTRLKKIYQTKKNTKNYLKSHHLEKSYLTYFFKLCILFFKGGRPLLVCKKNRTLTGSRAPPGEGFADAGMGAGI